MTKLLRCAIYTRKSSEEGLDQNFNSLDAQREACEAYIASQRQEGWKLLKTRYDDGGYSGGNMQRPGLQQLLADIHAGQVDLVVVYKIDRLTRSLMDFAKMVELFDKQGTSFVSVTQHFNTTSSMGRLTLNVLLSFAQFEREVTGERIRDKVAASKAKGMWMGGIIPFGYDVKDRALVVNPEDAAKVRSLFERYLKLGCVDQLKDELDTQGFKTKVRISRAGNRSGGTPLSRGAIYHQLRNRIYLGEIHHAGKFYPGQHEAIIPKELWDKVQAKLDTNRQLNQTKTRALNANLLAGMVFDGQGQGLVTKHTAKGAKRYRYYWLKGEGEGPTTRGIPGHDLERIVEREWKNWLTAPDLDHQLDVDQPSAAKEIRQAGKALAAGWDQRTTAEKRATLLALRAKIEMVPDRITLSVQRSAILKLLVRSNPDIPSGEEVIRVSRSTGAAMIRIRGERRVLEDDNTAVTEATAAAREQLLRTVALGRKWGRELINGEIGSLTELSHREKRAESYLYDVLRASTLSPKIVQQLMDGVSDVPLNTSMFKEGFSYKWDEQAAYLTAG